MFWLGLTAERIRRNKTIRVLVYVACGAAVFFAGVFGSPYRQGLVLKKLFLDLFLSGALFVLGFILGLLAEAFVWNLKNKKSV